MTDSQKAALEWLQEHGGTGIFDREGVLLAAGERAPHMRSTWNVLRDIGLLTIEKRRLTITELGVNFSE